MNTKNIKSNNQQNNAEEVLEEVIIDTKEPVKSKTYTHPELHDALLFIQDMFERSKIEFFLLGDTAKAILSTDLPEFKMDMIHVGVKRQHWNTAGQSIFKSLLGLEHADYLEDENGLIIYSKGVMIQVDIFDEQLPFLEYLDSKFYMASEFKIPNPIDSYIKYFERNTND